MIFFDYFINQLRNRFEMIFRVQFLRFYLNQNGVQRIGVAWKCKYLLGFGMGIRDRAIFKNVFRYGIDLFLIHDKYSLRNSNSIAE